MNITFYLRHPRSAAMNGKGPFNTVTVDISRITHVEYVSNVACRVTVLDSPEQTIMRPMCAASQHLIRGDRASTLEHIKRMAIKNGTPIRLKI